MSDRKARLARRVAARAQKKAKEEERQERIDRAREIEKMRIRFGNKVNDDRKSGDRRKDDRKTQETILNQMGIEDRRRADRRSKGSW